MTRFTTVRRTALTLAALGVLTLAGPLPAALAEPFQASGSYQFTRVQGNTTEGVVSGRAAPGGYFDGILDQRFHGGNYVGTATLVFRNGTLTLSYDVEFDDEIG